ncbi:VOC family protein [Nonomuraea ferruginea]
MLTTEFLPGSPCWVDVGSPDIEATASFYSDLFGWRFQPAMEGYGFWQADGKTVAAAGSVMEEGAAASWMVYFQTPDCDATAKAVELAGGLVRAQPFDIEGQGRMAQFTDPAGGGVRGLAAGWHARPRRGDRSGVVRLGRAVRARHRRHPRLLPVGVRLAVRRRRHGRSDLPGGLAGRGRRRLADGGAGGAAAG